MRLPDTAPCTQASPCVPGIFPDEAPDQIALLKLDTDWYESTLHELNHLYDWLSPGGILIIDDYQH